MILAPSGCCLPRCAPGLSRTGSREAEPTTNNRLSIPSPAHLPRERTSERSPVLGRTKSRRVQNAKASRGALGVHALARSPAAPLKRVSLCLITHSDLRRAASTLTPPLFSAAFCLLTFLRKSTNDVRFLRLRFVSSTSLGSSSFFPPLLINFREIKHPQSVS